MIVNDDIPTLAATFNQLVEQVVEVIDDFGTGKNKIAEIDLDDL